MPILPRLLKVGSMSESLGVYVPAMLLQKTVALARVLLFAYLLTKVQYGLWGLGMMIFTLAAPLVTLGSSHGLIRYVSLYEARGRLGAFYRRMRLGVLACTLVLTVAALAGSRPITRGLMASRSGGAEVAYCVQLHVCMLALANALVGALYHNMLGFMAGMRTYRMLSAVEVLFALTFTLAGVVALLVEPTGVAILQAHLVALAAAVAVGMALLHVAINRPSAEAASRRRPGTDEPPVGPTVPPGAAEKAPADELRGVYRRVLGYGLAALLGTLLWQAAGYVSFWLTSRTYGKADAGVFYLFLLLGQPVVFLANTVWMVLFSHVARLWEVGRRAAAMQRLETAYKAVALATSSLAVLIYVTSPLWVRVLPPVYRPGRELLGGLLMFFTALNHLGLMSMLARLHERPIVIALAALAGGAANVALALWWMPAGAAAGAAWAAGVGMYAGGGAVALIYLAACGERLHGGSYLVLLLPVVLLLPAGALGPVWAGLLAVAIFSPWVFTRRQKRLLMSLIRPRQGFTGADAD